MPHQILRYQIIKLSLLYDLIEMIAQKLKALNIKTPSKSKIKTYQDKYMS